MPSNTSPARRGEDRTRDAVDRWARALPAASYAITVVPADPGAGTPPHRRCWSLNQLLRAIPWLRRLNSIGHHIVGRPVDPRQILIDDLHADALTALRRHHRPAAVVASSPGSLQAWVTISETSVDPALADAAAKLLARRYGGDLCAARASQPGRLPGFTNRKTRHLSRETGLYPYALLIYADGPIVDPGAAALLQEASAIPAERRDNPNRPITGCPGSSLDRSPAAEHADGMKRLISTLPSGETLDRSRADFAIARRLASRGVSVEQIVPVILAGERASGLAPEAAQEYARRTAQVGWRTGRNGPQER
ncbi:DNA-primase RepB domain-containing protein [Pararoseomonas sp. SCSIO 73927]|uniref:DNA-primase RepB domain-containing protein n=1 Tax=Pararoseomonas sp. SCSIO 73927 TaxID=3114537 RepID=UPI0030D1A588